MTKCTCDVCGTEIEAGKLFVAWRGKDICGNCADSIGYLWTGNGAFCEDCGKTSDEHPHDGCKWTWNRGKDGWVNKNLIVHESHVATDVSEENNQNVSE
jgi:predicted amidophosphoribosyltransferase